MEKQAEPQFCSYPSCAALVDTNKSNGLCREHKEFLDRFLWALSRVNVQGRPVLEVVGVVAQSMNQAQSQTLARKLSGQIHGPNGGLLRR